MGRKIIMLIICAGLAGLLYYYFQPYQKMADGIVVEEIKVYKSAHKMDVYTRGKLVKTYSIAIGSNPVGAKQVEGDKKTPEGKYFIFNKNPNSGWHKNLGISYPNINDIAQSAKLGMNTGGDIKIHGLENGGFPYGRFHRWIDWTNGCIAITNEEMDDLFEHTATGIPIVIYP